MALRFSNDINKRFDKYFNCNFVEDAIYLVTAFLNPRFIRLMTTEQRKLAKDHLKDNLKKFTINTNGESHESEQNQENYESDNDFESFLMGSLNYNHQNKNDFENEINLWEIMSFGINISVKVDVINYWKECTSIEKFPNLKTLALHLLSIPGSTIGVERLFSLAGYACLGRNNKLKSLNLENVMLKANCKSLKCRSEFNC